MKKGFTLIELIVVMAVLMVFLLTTFVGFNKYNQNQKLNSAADDLRNNLNEAKSNALSGFIYQCSPSESLYGYKINVHSATSYRTYEICRDNISLTIQQPELLPNKVFNLPSGVSFDTTDKTPVNTYVIFQSVSGIPDSSSTITFKLNSGTTSKTVTVEPSGIIK